MLTNSWNFDDMETDVRFDSNYSYLNVASQPIRVDDFFTFNPASSGDLESHINIQPDAVFSLTDSMEHETVNPDGVLYLTEERPFVSLDTQQEKRYSQPILTHALNQANPFFANYYNSNEANYNSQNQQNVPSISSVSESQNDEVDNFFSFENNDETSVISTDTANSPSYLSHSNPSSETPSPILSPLPYSVNMGVNINQPVQDPSFIDQVERLQRSINHLIQSIDSKNRFPTDQLYPQQQTARPTYILQPNPYYGAERLSSVPYNPYDMSLLQNYNTSRYPDMSGYPSLPSNHHQTPPSYWTSEKRKQQLMRYKEKRSRRSCREVDPLKSSQAKSRPRNSHGQFVRATVRSNN